MTLSDLQDHAHRLDPSVHQPPNVGDLQLSGVPDGARVVVAMSGGVDSSVVAALMKQQGYDVVGITLQLYDHGAAIKKKGACCAGQDIYDARRVAEALDIPHYVLDYQDRFKTSVIDDFVESYLAGETPIPCIQCNERVKFRDLLDTARDLDAHCLVTGHYVRWVRGAGGPEMHRAVDSERDQSYFLYRTTRQQLDFLRFPLGDLSKTQTRILAARFGLKTALKADSQDICFVPEGRYTDVIERLRPGAAEPGDIVHVDGRVLGRHGGVMGFTVGQRKGLGVATGAPLYVVRVDAERRCVIVGPREALQTFRLQLRDINWLGDGSWQENAGSGMTVRAKVRSTRPAVPARLAMDEDGQLEVILDDGEDGVAPGQACVLYQSFGAGSRLLGGGWIKGTSGRAEKSP